MMYCRKCGVDLKGASLSNVCQTCAMLEQTEKLVEIQKNQNNKPLVNFGGGQSEDESTDLKYLGLLIVALVAMYFSFRFVFWVFSLMLFGKA